MDPKLEAAYRATTYVAESVGVRIRIDAQHPSLDALLIRHSSTTWAFISAWNPESKELSTADNVARHEQLRSILLAQALPHFPGQGVPDKPGWTPEESFLILGMDRERAVDLGRRFGQTAIVWGQVGCPAELTACTE